MGSRKKEKEVYQKKMNKIIQFLKHNKRGSLNRPNLTLYEKSGRKPVRKRRKHIRKK